MMLRMTSEQVWLLVFFNIGFLVWFIGSSTVFLLTKKTPLLTALTIFFASQVADRAGTLLVLLGAVRALPPVTDQWVFWIRVLSYILMSYAFVGLSYTLIKIKAEEFLRERSKPTG